MRYARGARAAQRTKGGGHGWSGRHFRDAEWGGGMSAIRKAGVWLGLVEEDEDTGYEERGYRESSYRDGERSRDRERYSPARYSGEFGDEDDDLEEERSVPRARSERSRPSDRL